MKRYSQIKLIAAFVFFVVTSDAVAGVKEVNNGAEDIHYEDGAGWFYNPSRTIQVCYTLSSEFREKIGVGRIEAAIRGGFDTWKGYIQKKQIRLSGTILDFSYSMRSKCLGVEDLVFKFGTFDEEVTAAQSKFTRAVSFAIKNRTDLKSNWAQGFIWVAPQGSLGWDTNTERPFPDWSMSFNIEGILLHELGHIFGNSHVPGTIMDENIARYIKWPWEPQRKVYLSRIDNKRELFLCEGCDFKQPGLLGEQTFNPTPSGIHDQRIINFRLLMGRSPVGLVKAEFSVQDKKSFLTVQDDQGSHSFELTLKKGSARSVAPGPSIFKYMSSVEMFPLGGGSYSSSSASYSMTLTTAEGKKLSVRLERNVGGFSFFAEDLQIQPDLVHILLESDDDVKILFGAQWAGYEAGFSKVTK